MMCELFIRNWILIRLKMACQIENVLNTMFVEQQQLTQLAHLRFEFKCDLSWNSHGHMIQVNFLLLLLFGQKGPLILVAICANCHQFYQ